MVSQSPESLSLAKVAAQAGSYTEHVESPPHSPLVPGWGWDQEKAGTCVIEIKMAAGGGRGAGPKRPVSLAGGKKGLVAR